MQDDLENGDATPSRETDRRQCEIGIGAVGSVDDEEIQMDSGMCQADACGVFEVENPAPNGSNFIKPLCETHRELLTNGPDMIVGEINLPSDSEGGSE